MGDHGVALAPDLRPSDPLHTGTDIQTHTDRRKQSRDEMGDHGVALAPDLRPSDPLDIHTDRHITLAESKLMISHSRRQRQCSKPQQNQTITSTIHSFIHH